MAKQTFTTGQVLTAAQVNSLQTNDFNQTVSVKTAAYVLAAADKGTRIEFNTSGSVSCTVNTGLFDAGDTVIIQNRGAGDVTVTAGTATVNTAGSLVLSQYQSGTLYFISASASIFFAAAVGDLTAVTSGTGISISNAGGPVPTITNSMATEISAKGDLIVGTGSGSFDNLAVGTNGHTLVADSSTATGLKWQAATSSSGPAFEARRNGNQTVTASTQTKIEFNQEDYDTDNCFDPTTNYRFTPNKAGYYQINLTVVAENSAGTLRVLGSIYKNGSVYSRLIDNTPNSTITQQTGSSLIYFNGTTDYVEGYVSIGGTSGTMVPDNGTGLEAVFSGVWIRS